LRADFPATNRCAIAYLDQRIDLPQYRADPA
jgi:hypothetical protein